MSKKSRRKSLALHHDHFLLKKMLGKVKQFWHFVWYDDSLLSWLVNVVFAYLFIKFLVYPGLGLLLGTHYPVVAVVSNSMYHHPEQIGASYKLCGKTYLHPPAVHSFDDWWNYCGNWYEQRGMNKEVFQTYPLANGFSRGDLIVLRGVDPATVQRGEIIVFQSDYKPDPIIHRLMEKEKINGTYVFMTKGDNNPVSYPQLDQNITQDRLLGKAWFKIPYLGYVKIWFFEMVMKIINLWR